MDEVVRIAPLESEPGLIGYECPACCYVTSVLLQSKDGQKRRSLVPDGALRLTRLAGCWVEECSLKLIAPRSVW